MAAYRGWWAVAGGWAVDLHLGRQTRTHDDVEVTTLRADLDLLHGTFPGSWEFVQPHPLGFGDAGIRHPWDGSHLSLPVHQVAVAAPNGRLDVVLSEGDGAVWRFRRDPRVTLPLGEAALQAAQGLPYLAPAVVLLFKAKRTLPKDERDFAELGPALAATDREWLRTALTEVSPRHPWLDCLQG